MFSHGYVFISVRTCTLCTLRTIRMVQYVYYVYSYSTHYVYVNGTAVTVSVWSSLLVVLRRYGYPEGRRLLYT
jgi:hypothetical protein